jgi:hypothetical protein
MEYKCKYRESHKHKTKTERESPAGIEDASSDLRNEIEIDRRVQISESMCRRVDRVQRAWRLSKY